MMNKNLKRTIVMSFLALAFGLVVSATAQAQISIVVSKASSHSPSADELKSYFAAVKFQWADGAKIQIVDQADTELEQQFYTKFLGKTVGQIRKEWTKLMLSGQATAPIKCANDEAVKKALSANPHAVGFISSSALDANVKEIFKIQ